MAAFRLILAIGLILDGEKRIGKVVRLEGGKCRAEADGRSAEAWSPERAAEKVCRLIDPMRNFLMEREDDERTRRRRKV